MEGSKAGATAASVWAAHHVLPLNVTGYGKLMGASIEGAHRFYNFLNDLSFKVGDKEIEVHVFFFVHVWCHYAGTQYSYFSGTVPFFI